MRQVIRLNNAEGKDIILSVRNLKQYFRISKHAVVKAVDDISFDVYRGETFGLVGESGSGKSTTGRSIIKLYNITDGEIYFNGTRSSVGLQSITRDISDLQKKIKFTTKTQILVDEQLNIISASKDQIEYLKRNNDNGTKRKIDTLKSRILKAKNRIKELEKKEYSKPQNIEEIKRLNQLRKEDLMRDVRKRNEYKKENVETDDFSKNVQMIFQDPMACLNPRMTVKNIVAEGLVIHKLFNSTEERDEKVYSILNKVGLSREHADRYPHEFSGGQRQRIGIARALITAPKFVIADEPISALDVSIQAQVVNLMDDLKDELGLTYLFIAHDLSMVKYISDRIGVMHLGKLVELGTSDEIYNNPIHPYTRSLLSAIPQPDPKSERERERIVYDKDKVDYNKGRWRLVGKSKTHYVLATDKELEEWKK